MVGKKTLFSQEIVIPLKKGSLTGNLDIPSDASQIVIFVHGSGSSRLSPRNQKVARFLQEENFATFLFDLLTLDEDETHRFEIPLLVERLLLATQTIQNHPETKKFTLSFFGASTGAAAALIAASQLGEKIRSVVSRGGRPDLALHHLHKVRSPTLLIVGGSDFGVIELNQKAYDLLSCEKRLEIIEGATHLFEERGALEQVSMLAAKWFNNH